MTESLSGLSLRRAVLEACGWTRLGIRQRQLSTELDLWGIAPTATDGLQRLTPAVEESLDAFTAYVRPEIEKRGLQERWALEVDNIVNWGDHSAP